MTHYQLFSIRSVGPDMCIALFRRGSEELAVRFTITEHDGIRTVQPEPDIFMPGLVKGTREIAAAVIAFNLAVSATKT